MILAELVALIRPKVNQGDVTKAENIVKSAGSRIAGYFSSFGEAISHMITRFLGPLAILHELLNFGKQVWHAALLGNELFNISQIVNVGVENVQGLIAAAADVNVEIHQVEIGLRRLSFVMNKAVEGTKGFADILPGRWWEDGNGKVLTATEMMMKLADIINAMPNDIHKTAKMHVLLGRTGERLEPLFNKGSKAITDYIAKLKEYGLAMDEEGVKKSVDLNHAFQDLRLRWQGLLQQIAQTGAIESLGHIITFVAQRVTALMNVFRKTTNGLDEATKMQEGLSAAFLVLSAIILQKAVPSFTALGTAGLWAGLKTFGVWLAVAGVIWLAAKALNDLWVFMNGGKSVFGEMANEIADTWVGSVLTALGGVLKILWDIFTLITDPFNANNWIELGETIKGIFRAVGDFILKTVKGLIGGMGKLFGFGDMFDFKMDSSKKPSQAITPTAGQLGRARAQLAQTQSVAPASFPVVAPVVQAPMSVNVQIDAANMTPDQLVSKVEERLQSFDETQRKNTYAALYSSGAQ